MKDFPRLHSLHTLNIRHHQHADYSFHQLRTDFIGESGAGKSIIADLLQLVFVGPREHRSATQSLDDERKPKTLLLPGELLGYAFLNIETAEGQYVVVGVQIEDVYHGVRLFVIQRGFELDELSRLIPFAEPITSKDVLVDNDMLPLSELANHLEKRGLLVKQFLSTKAYHALLYRSELLPFDLASSEQSLKTYAKIIQSFSRRQSLDPKKPKELIEFLFGNDKGQENYKQYEDLMRSVERDDDDYRLNRAEVELIKEKEAALQSLRTTQKRFLEAKRVYDLALLQDSYERRRLTKQKLYKAFEQYTTSTRTIEHWQTYCRHQHAEFEKQEAPLLLAEQEALTTYTQKLQPFQHIQKVDEWLKRWGSSLASLPQYFKKYNESKKVREAYGKLDAVFTTKEHWKQFEQSGWVNGWERGIQWSDKKLDDLQDDKRKIEALCHFSDVTDSTTLCHWAYHCEFDFDEYDIGVFLGFMLLPIERPIIVAQGDRYLPNPDELFRDLSKLIVNEDNRGFELAFKGVHDYFEFRKDLINDLSEPKKRKDFLLKQSQASKTKLREIEVEHKCVLELQKLIDQLGEQRIDILNAYAKRNKYSDVEEYLPFHISQEEFDACCSYYEKQDSIKTAYDTADSVYRAAQNSLQTLRNNVSLLINHAVDYEALNKPYINTADLVEQYIREHVNDFVKPIWEAPQTDFHFTTNYQSARAALLTGQQYMLPDDEWSNLFRAYEQAGKHYDTIANSYENLYGKLPSLPIEQDLGGVDHCQSRYTKAESQYESEYRQIAKDFLGDYAVELDNVYDYLILVNYLFPRLIDDNAVNEEAALGRITQRLTEVLNRIRELNKRRLNQISELLGGVVEDWRELGNNLRRIGRFFEDSKHHITGGHRVKLTVEDSISFPIKWINEFRRELATSNDFADQFVDQITFKEKIIAAFKACSGVRPFNLDIPELLNPNSYLNLDFSIVSINDSGKTNDGSTGQTYAAIALLCIARLSLIGRVRRKGIRFMPVDEAEGLGSNYDMLYDIARNNDYQLISMSINLVGPFKEGNQYVHMLQRDLDSPEPVNYTPYSIFSQSDLDDLLDNTDSDGWHDSIENDEESNLGFAAGDIIDSDEETESGDDSDENDDQEEDEEGPTT